MLCNRMKSWVTTEMYKCLSNYKLLKKNKFKENDAYAQNLDEKNRIIYHMPENETTESFKKFNIVIDHVLPTVRSIIIKNNDQISGKLK